MILEIEIVRRHRSGGQFFVAQFHIDTAVRNIDFNYITIHYFSDIMHYTYLSSPASQTNGRLRFDSGHPNIGYICKPPVYRKTPLGREIADLLMAVNRPYGKSDYIPCICWGRNARYASAFAVGGHVLIWGRIQSREYVKKLGENQAEKRIAYEVSVSKLEYME